MFFPPKSPDPIRARRFLARHGDELAFDLLDHKEADLRGKGTGAVEEIAQLRAFRDAVAEQREQPHRLGDLAIDGNDLIEVGYEPGPAIGETLERLLHEVVGDPSLNRRDWLLHEAARLL
jgi:tRNA nucleotidyltransferase (CCA-adding enzyme)